MDRFGAWSTEGCRMVMKEGNRLVCECTQLAHFGILFVSPIFNIILYHVICIIMCLTQPLMFLL